MKNKKQMIITASLTLIMTMLLLVSYASAYKLVCLTYGQSVPSSQNPRYTCHSDVCQLCLTDTNYPTAPGYCLHGGGTGGCEGGGNTTLDTQPPVLTINSPIENQIYNSRQVIFDLKTNEPASIFYTDNINGRGVWKKIANGIESYQRGISFKDGLNDITIRATDRNGNSVEILKKFSVDSTKPKIKKTLPSKGFADGNFEIQFVEANPKSLILNYGNSATGQKTAALNLNSCEIIKGLSTCRINVDLSSYNNQNINFWFALSDIADNLVTSKSITLSVDALNPIINNPGSMYIKNGKYVYFSININEPNLDEVSYIDNSASNPRWTKICTKLKNGLCEKKITLKSGTHEIEIMVSDKAGNSISQLTSIVI